MKNNEERTRAEQLADEHWAYIFDLLKMHGQEELDKIEFHYKSAMIHGYKHGQADANEIKRL